MALMPVAGDVDCVVAAELVEAGRAMARGLVTPERTTLIASSHREYTISERSAMGRAVGTEDELIEIARAQAQRFILFDMADMAAKRNSVISAVLLGAIAGSGVLPFGKDAFEAAIRRSGLAVDTNLAAFNDAFHAAAAGIVTRPASTSPAKPPGDIPTQAGTPAGMDLLLHLRALPLPVQPLALAGVRRLIDYQDPAYAKLYLERLGRIVRLEAAHAAAAGDWSLSEATARSLALWMSFEDTIRVADLKTRGARTAEVRDEIRASPGQLIDVIEYMKPRVAEIAGTLPAAWGRRLQRSPWATRLVARFTGGRRVRSTTITGFLLLRAVARLRRTRRGTLRYQVENSRIEEWLRRIEEVSPGNLALGAEVARAQRLIKGYGDTHERGWRSFASLLAQLERLQSRADGAAVFARLQVAALADEQGAALALELAGLGVAAARVGTPAAATEHA